MRVMLRTRCSSKRFQLLLCATHHLRPHRWLKPMVAYGGLDAEFHYDMAWIVVFEVDEDRPAKVCEGAAYRNLAAHSKQGA